MSKREGSNTVFRSRDMVYVAVMAAVLAVLAQFSIPMPTGTLLTLQTFAVALCGSVLGIKKGLAAVGVYLLLGAVGLPVFASFRGGLGILAGDYLKESSDMNVNMVAVGLLYRYGYFRQKISVWGDQIAEDIPQDFNHDVLAVTINGTYLKMPVSDLRRVLSSTWATIRRWAYIDELEAL